MQTDGRKMEYSRQELLDVKSSVTGKLSSDLWKNIKSLGIVAVNSTRRSKRAGKSRIERLQDKAKNAKQKLGKVTTLSLLNCQSVKNKSSKVLSYVLENDCDICALVENWLKVNIDERIARDITPDGYTFIGAPRKQGRGGGVGVLLKENLSHVRQPDLSFEPKSFEHLQLLITINSICIRLFVVYRIPPSKKNRFEGISFLR